MIIININIPFFTTVAAHCETSVKKLSEYFLQIFAKSQNTSLHYAEDGLIVTKDTWENKLQQCHHYNNTFTCVFLVPNSKQRSLLGYRCNTADL